MAGQVVHPPLLPQLRHDGVDPGVARAALLPRLDALLAVHPGDLRQKQSDRTAQRLCICENCFVALAS